MACRVRPMNKIDIPQVSVIDREAFPTMWPPVNFAHELSNRLAHYLVACDSNKLADPENRNTLKLVPVRSFLGIKWPFGSKNPALQPDDRKVEYILGFVGMWLMVDEAHIINIAVRQENRGQGIGELLIIASIDQATRLKASVVTLEVRASNVVAQNLYTKYGFAKVGLRKGYYTDNHEDAFIMTTDIITSTAFKETFQKLSSIHFQKIGCCDYDVGAMQGEHG